MQWKQLVYTIPNDPSLAKHQLDRSQTQIKIFISYSTIPSHQQRDRVALPCEHRLFHHHTMVTSQAVPIPEMFASKSFTGSGNEARPQPATPTATLIRLLIYKHQLLRIYPNTLYDRVYAIATRHYTAECAFRCVRNTTAANQVCICRIGRCGARKKAKKTMDAGSRQFAARKRQN